MASPTGVPEFIPSSQFYYGNLGKTRGMKTAHGLNIILLLAYAIANIVSLAITCSNWNKGSGQREITLSMVEGAALAVNLRLLRRVL